MPNLVPEDSMLRRHYLTEVKNNMDKHFDRFLEETQEKEQTIVYAQPIWSKSVLIPTVAFLFFLAVLFL